MARALGVDISSCQGSVDFAALKAGGFDFIIEKGTQGGMGVDPTFAGRVEAARRAGVLVPLMYHVLTQRAPINQQVANACNHATDYDLEIALDFEVEGTSAMQALQFAEGCRSRGRRVVVYSYPVFIKRADGSSALLLLAQNTEYWSADYSAGQKKPPPDSWAPFIPRAWGGRWLLAQYSGDGGLPAPGIPSVVDHNVWNGSREDLIAWMTGNKAETAPGTPTTSGPSSNSSSGSSDA